MDDKPSVFQLLFGNLKSIRVTTEPEKVLVVTDDILAEEIAVRWFLCDLQESKREDRSVWDHQPQEVKDVFLAKARLFAANPSAYEVRFREASNKFPSVEFSVNHIHHLAESLLKYTTPLQSTVRKIRKAAD